MDTLHISGKRKRKSFKLIFFGGGNTCMYTYTEFHSKTSEKHKPSKSLKQCLHNQSMWKQDCQNCGRVCFFWRLPRYNLHKKMTCGCPDNLTKITSIFPNPWGRNGHLWIEVCISTRVFQKWHFEKNEMTTFFFFLYLTVVTLADIQLWKIHNQYGNKLLQPGPATLGCITLVKIFFN